MPRQYYSPENTFVLIVYCMVDPVDEERRTIGDVGLLNAFLEYAPECNVLHLSDSKTTKITSTIARENLERLLGQIPERTEPCQVVVYYGGHGKPKGLCMDDGLCRYRDLVALMEAYLDTQDSCWFLVDCCYSGNACTFLQQRVVETGQHLKASYCCIMSTTHDEEADGDEWCLPGAFVAVMEGRVPRHYNDIESNGNDSEWVPTIAQAVSFMADQHATTKMDRMTAYICGPCIHPDDPFPFVIGGNDSAFSHGQRLVARSTPMLRGGGSDSHDAPPPRMEQEPLQDLKVGDAVYAKWRGGKPTNDSIHLLPTWYPATVTAIDDDNAGSVRVKFEYETPKMTWDESDVKRGDITGILTFNYRYYNDTPSGIERAQCHMAKCGKYIDYSIPVGTRVKALWQDDDVLYDGTIMSDRDLPWKKMGKHYFEEKYPGTVGPYVIVEWTEEENWTIVPLCHVFVVPPQNGDSTPTVEEMRNHAKTTIEQESLLSHSPMECLMESLHSAGKTLVPAEQVVGGGGTTRLIGFWAEDSEWYGGTPGSLNETDLNVLASHLRYKENGEYCIVCWNEDGSKSCLPASFVRRR